MRALSEKDAHGGRRENALTCRHVGFLRQQIVILSLLVALGKVTDVCVRANVHVCACKAERACQSRCDYAFFRRAGGGGGCLGSKARVFLDYTWALFDMTTVAMTRHNILPGLPSSSRTRAHTRDGRTLSSTSGVTNWTDHDGFERNARKKKNPRQQT